MGSLGFEALNQVNPSSGLASCPSFCLCFGATARDAQGSLLALRPEVAPGLGGGGPYGTEPQPLLGQPRARPSKRPTPRRRSGPGAGSSDAEMNALNRPQKMELSDEIVRKTSELALN